MDEVKPIQYEHTINGKRVTMRRRLPNKEARQIFKLASEMASITEDTERAVPLAQLLIESWEFAGSPQEAASYEGLDIFDEMIPLAMALGEFVHARMIAAGLAKN